MSYDSAAKLTYGLPLNLEINGKKLEDILFGKFATDEEEWNYELEEFLSENEQYDVEVMEYGVLSDEHPYMLTAGEGVYTDSCEYKKVDLHCSYGKELEWKTGIINFLEKEKILENCHLVEKKNVFDKIGWYLTCSFG